jgi:hypothetical protein
VVELLWEPPIHWKSGIRKSLAYTGKVKLAFTTSTDGKESRKENGRCMDVLQAPE